MEKELQRIGLHECQKGDIIRLLKDGADYKIVSVKDGSIAMKNMETGKRVVETFYRAPQVYKVTEK